MVSSYKYVKKNYKKDKLLDYKFDKECKEIFKSCSDNYFDFLSHYFDIKGGKLVGFRFIGRFIEPQKPI